MNHFESLVELESSKIYQLKWLSNRGGFLSDIHSPPHSLLGKWTK